MKVLENACEWTVAIQVFDLMLLARVQPNDASFSGLTCIQSWRHRYMGGYTGMMHNKMEATGVCVGVYIGIIRLYGNPKHNQHFPGRLRGGFRCMGSLGCGQNRRDT